MVTGLQSMMILDYEAREIDLKVGEAHLSKHMMKITISIQQ